MRILIADDDPQILRALRITLGARGYEILLARDGEHALEMAVDHKPDVLLLDLVHRRRDQGVVLRLVLDPHFILLALDRLERTGTTRR